MTDEQLTELVDRFLEDKGCDGDEWDEYYRSLPFAKALRHAAFARGPGVPKHDHQRVIPPHVLRATAERLLSREREIRACRDFDSLYALVDECAVPGFGLLCKYDTAQRIGVNVGLKPEKVYLHAGVKEGARELGLDMSRGYVEPEELPVPLQELEPDDVETFLCRYKRHLAAGALSHPGRHGRGCACRAFRGEL